MSDTRNDELPQLLERLGFASLEVDVPTRTVVSASPVYREYGVYPGLILSEEVVARLLGGMEIADADRAALLDLMAGRFDEVCSVTFRSQRGGHWSWRRVDACVQRSATGAPLRLLSVDCDITEQVEAHREAQRAELLRRISARLHDGTALEEAAASVCHEVKAALGCDMVTLLLFDEGTGGTRILHRAGGPSDSEAPPLELARIRPYLPRLGPSAQVPDVAAAAWLPSRMLLTSLGVRSVATAPFGSLANPIGFLSAYAISAPRRFDPQEMALLESVAAAVAGPLVRAVLAEERARAEASLRAAEEARAASERRYREIVENMTEGMMLADYRGRIALVNPALAAMFGYAPDEMVGMAAMDLMFPEDHEARRREWKVLTAARAPSARRTLRFRTRAGEELWASGTGVPLREGERVTGILGILADVTESRRLEQKLQQAQRLESLGVLAGGIAHDFNNLLVGVLGNAGLALADLPAGSPVRESLEQIETAALRASELTRQMLAYAGKGRFLLERIDLRQVVEEMGQLLGTVIGKRVTLRLEFSADVPRIEGDPAQLRQVVMNLITNASDAIGEQDGVVTVRAGAVEVLPGTRTLGTLGDELTPGRYLRLEVLDTGVGMDERTRERIFEPFFTTKFIGRGLGLAAVLGIVRAHRGSIDVASEPGRGTSFRLLLPALAEAAVAPLPTAPPEAGSAAAAPRPAALGTVLVVDDEETVREVARKVLERAGYEVLLAEDGASGVERYAAARGRIRAVVLDVSMPRMDGVEAFGRLREIDPGVRVLLASGHSEQEAERRFGGDEPSLRPAGFLEKPFQARTLVERLRAVLEGGDGADGGGADGGEASRRRTA